MNLNITGHHIEVTSAIREYVTEKISKVTRHFDQVIDVNVILSVEKLVQKAEVNVHVSEDANLYAAIDSLVDKLDRQVVKHKEKNGNHHRGEKKNIIIEE